MKKSSIILIALIAVAIAMILVIYTDSSTYSTFSEAKEKKTELYVVGVLNKDKALHYDPKTNANHFSFYMYDSDSTECEVVFNGSKPQDIERSEQLLLRSRYILKDISSKSLRHGKRYHPFSPLIQVVQNARYLVVSNH